MDLTRRRLVGGLAAGSTFGIGAGTLLADPVAADPATAESTPGAATEEHLVLSCNDLRLASAGRGAPAVGDTDVLSGSLTDTASGAEGALYGEFRVIASGNQVGASAPTSLETHHFILPDGAITGTGTASLDDSADSFVIVGGTGAYHGAQGSYAAQQDPRGLGGNGTATYTFTFITLPSAATNTSQGA